MQYLDGIFYNYFRVLNIASDKPPIFMGNGFPGLPLLLNESDEIEDSNTY